MRVWIAAIALVAAGCSSAPSRHTLPEAPLVTPPAATTSGTRNYYVDGSLSTNPCTRYSPGTRTCGSGRELAFNNLTDANGMAQAGDTIRVRAGTYAEHIAPIRSGTESHPITYRAQDEGKVRIAGIEGDQPAIWLIGVQHINVSGFLVEHVVGWGRLENAHHNRIVGNNFREAIARGTTGGLKIVESHYNTVRDNTFYRGNDSIVLQVSDRNLIEDNHLEFARHSLFSIRCGNFNIVRNNFLHNERQKIGEIYDCTGVSDAPIKLDATKRNLLEGNHFAFARGSDQPTRYSGLQFSGQYTLVRHNLFKENEGGAINFAVYADEALYVYGNRVVTNWFFDNRCYALSGLPGAGGRVGDNRVIGNVLSGNVDCLGYGRQVMRINTYELIENEEAQAPTNGLPRVWLTRTISAGEGTTIPVDDVLSFSDGFGIDARGDSIQIESTGEDAYVTRVDYQGRMLHLDRPMRWQGGDGIRVLSTNADQPFTVLPSERVVRLED